MVKYHYYFSSTQNINVQVVVHFCATSICKGNTCQLWCVENNFILLHIFAWDAKYMYSNRKLIREERKTVYPIAVSTREIIIIGKFKERNSTAIDNNWKVILRYFLQCCRRWRFCYRTRITRVKLKNVINMVGAIPWPIESHFDKYGTSK